MKQTKEMQIQPAIWAESVPDEEWEVYERVIRGIAASGPPFALGGAFALATYTGHLRNTKDLDIYVLPEDRESMIKVMTSCGLEDYHSKLPYDRGWIYRGYSSGMIVDIIWGMPNRRSMADTHWLTRGPSVEIRGHRLKILPAEELIWGKMYVMQRERCDWPDVMNLLYHTGAALDWQHLLWRAHDDTPVLASVVTLFSWLCPDRADEFPRWLWDALGITRRETRECGSRSHLLDTRPWFGEDFPHWPDK